MRGGRAIKVTSFGTTPNFDYRVRELEGYKMIRTFLIGILYGVIMAAAVTFVFTIPAIAITGEWRSGNAAAELGASTKNGHLSWKWMVEPIPGTSSEKRVIVPSSYVNVQSERL